MSNFPTILRNSLKTVMLLVVIGFKSTNSLAGVEPPGLKDKLRNMYERENVRYFSGTVDLNEDGFSEVIVHVAGPTACGTGGCNKKLGRKRAEF